MLFRGQPAVEEETDQLDKDGNPKIKRRKADDEYLIRRALIESRLIDAVISLPLNVFYGAGVPACLLIFRKQRPVEHRDQLLLIYAARHYRELSAQNELRPQDVMRMLVHVHAYGDAAKAPGSRGRARKAHPPADRCAGRGKRSGVLRRSTNLQAEKIAALDGELVEAHRKKSATATKPDKTKVTRTITKLEKERQKVRGEVRRTRRAHRRGLSPRRGRP